MSDKPKFESEAPTPPKHRTLEAQVQAILARTARIERTLADISVILGNLYRAQTANTFERDKMLEQISRRLNALELPGSGKR